MANPNESKWYYLSGTIYYITAIIVAAGAFLFKCCPTQAPTTPNPTVSTPTAPLPTQDTCKNIEEAVNQWVNQTASMSSAMQFQFLSPQTTAQRQLSDESLMEEGLLSDYLQKLRIHPKPLHLQACQWDEAHQYIKVLIFKE